MTQFNAIRSYDVPEVLLTQMIDGELSLSSTWETIMEGAGGDPRVPLNERDTIEQRLIQKYGGNAFADTAIGVLTNPLTYLMFITSPAGASATKGLFDVAPRLSAWAMEHMPLLHHLKVVTGNHGFRGTGIPPALEQFQRSVSRWREESKAIIRDSWKDFTARHNFKGEVATKRYKGDKNPNAVERMTTLLHLKLSRAFEDVTEAVPQMSYLIQKADGSVEQVTDIKRALKAHERGNKVMTNIDYKYETRSRMVNMTEEAIDEEIAKLGGTELAQAVMSQRDYALRKLFYDDKGVVDPEKLKRMYNSVRLSSRDAMSGATANGDQILQQFFGPEVTNLLRNGMLDEKTFNNMITNTFGGMFQQNAAAYMPRNYYQFFRGGTGEFIPRTSGAFTAIKDHRKGILSVSPNVRLRSGSDVFYDPQALARVEAVVGSGRMNLDFVADNQKRMAEAISTASKNDVIRALDIDAFESLARYDNSAQRTYALFVEKADDRTIDAWNRNIDMLRNGKDGQKISAEIASRDVRFRNDQPAFAKLDEIEAPEGGFTVADLIDVSDGMLGNTEKRKQLREIFIPRLTGEATANTMIAGLAASSARTVASSLMATDLGKALIKEEGVVGNLFKQVEKFAEGSLAMGSGLDQRVGSYLYTTHLGLNMGSVMANLTQPIITTARWVGFGDLAPAYSDTLKQYIGFAQDIAKKPKGYITNPTYRLGLIEKHFPLARESSLLKDSLDEMLDFDLRRTGVLTGMTPGSVFQNMRDVMLFPFQQAEIFNRVVTANAVARRNIRIGRHQGGRLTNEALDEVNRAVQETQFGTDLLNTPMFLLEGGLSNPLLKQFLQFPLRMAIAPFEVGGTLAGNDNTLLGIGKDLLRGIGISAVGYEIVKGTFKTDVSDLGFLESTMQLGGGVIDDEDGPLPIPPIIDIPVDIARGIADGDKQLVGRSVARMVPGGVALQRILNVAPPTNLGFFNYQSRYADWANPNEAGQVPVYDSNNSLISFENPETLLAQAVGLDRQGFKDEAELSRFIMKQAEAEREARKALINAIYTNNVPKAEQIRKDFENRYGYRLMVSKSQMQSANRLREQTRAERVLDRTPQDIRSQMARLVAKTDPNQGVPVEQFVAASRAAERDPHRLFSATDSLDPETRSYIARLLEGATNGSTDREVPQ